MTERERIQEVEIQHPKTVDELMAITRPMREAVHSRNLGSHYRAGRYRHRLDAPCRTAALVKDNSQPRTD